MKEILGLLATAIALAGYIPYFRDIWAGRTKPHAFSWLVWGILTAIGFFSQISDGAGPGAWVTGFTALVCVFIFSAALKNGRKDITALDWMSLVGAIFALICWWVTKTAFLSVLLISLIDLLGLVPTVRKSYYKPYEETLITYVLSGFKFVLAIAALEKMSFITAFYPASLIFSNFFFVTLLVIRRRALVALADAK
ncbi:MAG TPA: hypothetical protein VD999_04025 [Vitreimonas sp.]|nr:hypothetical protein [Vitreimonas sp.]